MCVSGLVPIRIRNISGSYFFQIDHYFQTNPTKTVHYSGGNAKREKQPKMKQTKPAEKEDRKKGEKQPEGGGGTGEEKKKKAKKEGEGEEKGEAGEEREKGGAKGGGGGGGRLLKNTLKNLKKKL